MTTERKIATEEQVERARAIHGSDDLEIDRGACVAEAECGFWVQAWVWVPYDEEGKKCS